MVNKINMLHFLSSLYCVGYLVGLQRQLGVVNLGHLRGAQIKSLLFRWAMSTIDFLIVLENQLCLGCYRTSYKKI